MAKIQIQAVLTTGNYRTSYWMKKENEPSKKISKKEWFRLYDLPDTQIEVLPPITKE